MFWNVARTMRLAAFCAWCATSALGCSSLEPIVAPPDARLVCEIAEALPSSGAVTFLGSTRGQPDRAMGSCIMTLGVGTPDVLLSFTPAVGGPHGFGIRPRVPGEPTPRAIYLWEGCSASCLVGAGTADETAEIGFVTELSAGVTYVVVVDGFEDAGQAGEFVLRITPP